MITAIIQGEPNIVTCQQKGVMVRNGKPMFFTKKRVQDSRDALILQLRKFAPRKPVDYPVLIRVKLAYKQTKARPNERRHGKRPDLSNSFKSLEDCLVKAGWLTDDGLVDQIVAEKFRVSDPYIEITMKEAL